MDKVKNIIGLAEMIETATDFKVTEKVEGYVTPVGSAFVKCFGLEFCRLVSTTLREHAELVRTTTAYSENAGIEETEG